MVPKLSTEKAPCWCCCKYCFIRMCLVSPRSREVRLLLRPLPEVDFDCTCLLIFIVINYHE